MLKLYKFTDTGNAYWETWANDDGSHTVYWGELGQRGQSRTIRRKFLRKPEAIVQKEIATVLSDGYKQADREFTLLIEYAAAEMGASNDIDKRHRLEERMNETLGWTGLGSCDGGSSGSGTMEVCCYVVDFEVAKKVIEHHLKGTEFEDYTRIYDEEVE